MSEIVYRSDLERVLTATEVDTNFSNLNADKLERQLESSVYEKIIDVAVVAGVVTIDLDEGSEFDVDVDDDITDIAFSNTPADGYASAVSVRFIQDATGGHTITVPSGFLTVGGTDLVLATDADSVSEVAFKIRNKGGVVITAYPVLGEIA